MEEFYGHATRDDEMIELPPGFRFHPTDEELVTHYLSRKVLDCNFRARAVGEVDLNKVEPWDLPWRAKIGEKECYFFCVRDRKYPSGSRTNRATEAGYWKATGKDKEIFRGKILVGMKKTLVFYRGRAPRGEKTSWVMHEYRLEGKNSNNFPKTTKKEWVICRVFKKSSGGNKVIISEFLRNDNPRLDLPPLMDVSSDEKTPPLQDEGFHVTCFSNVKQDPQNESDYRDITSSDFNFLNPSSIFSSQLNLPHSVLRQEQQYFGVNAEMPPTISKHEDGLKPYDDNQDFPIISTGEIDLDCLWNY